MQDLIGAEFLSTRTSWLFAILVAVIYVSLAYVLWYAGAIIQAAAVGALVFSGREERRLTSFG
jgi:uncharacterized membrane protein YqiK